MGLSVSASRGLWPGCGYGPWQQRLRLTGAVHNALWCTSNCPDISLNWANAPPALQSALLSLSLLPPPGPKAWATYPDISSCCKVYYQADQWTSSFLKSLAATNGFFSKSERILFTGDHLFCFNKGFLCFYFFYPPTSPHMQSYFKTILFSFSLVSI